MTPYYDEGGITIYHNDCREILPTLKPVDVVIADPPYSEHVHTKNRRGVGANSGALAVARDLGFESLSLGDLDEAALEISRLSRRWALVFSDVELCHLWREALTASAEPVRAHRNLAKEQHRAAVHRRPSRGGLRNDHHVPPGRAHALERRRPSRSLEVRR